MQLKIYKKQLKQIKNQIPDGWKLVPIQRLTDTSIHPMNYKDIECAFVSTYLNLPVGSHILNVGSYTQYIIGLLANYRVTSLDVRPRLEFMNTETVITKDIKDVDLPDSSFDAIISLSSIEHFGLGRYGDEIDLEADKKAFEQFKRLLKPGGLLFFTTTIKLGEPEICFNAHKTYQYGNIQEMCSGLQMVQEMFIDKSELEFCDVKEITDKSKEWDIYCGVWKKP